MYFVTHTNCCRLRRPCPVAACPSALLITYYYVNGFGQLLSQQAAFEQLVLLVTSNSSVNSYIICPSCKHENNRVIYHVVQNKNWIPAHVRHSKTAEICSNKPFWSKRSACYEITSVFLCCPLLYKPWMTCTTRGINSSVMYFIYLCFFLFSFCFYK